MIPPVLYVIDKRPKSLREKLILPRRFPFFLQVLLVHFGLELPHIQWIMVPDRKDLQNREMF